jgi:hypothetical protein
LSEDFYKSCLSNLDVVKQHIYNIQLQTQYIVNLLQQNGFTLLRYCQNQ